MNNIEFIEKYGTCYSAGYDDTGFMVFFMNNDKNLSCIETFKYNETDTEFQLWCGKAYYDHKYETWTRKINVYDSCTIEKFNEMIEDIKTYPKWQDIEHELDR